MSTPDNPLQIISQITKPNKNEFLFGKKGKSKQLKTTNPMQDDLLQMISDALTSGEGPLADLFGGFNQEQFDKGVTDPALKNFQEKILPMLQEKFIAGGAVGGSGQRQGFEQAGTDLQSKLAELMYQAQQGQKQNQVQGVNSVLGKNTFENLYKPGTQGAVQGFLQGVGEGVGKAGTAAIAG